MRKSKYQVGDIIEAFHIPEDVIHLLIEDIDYWNNKPYTYYVRNLEEDETYEKSVEKIDKSIYYRKVA